MGWYIAKYDRLQIQFKIHSQSSSMKVLQAILLAGLIGYCCCFLTGCKEFSPLNFNQCFSCKDGYYVDVGKCKLCPSGNQSIKQCLKPDSTTVIQDLQSNIVETPQMAVKSQVPTGTNQPKNESVSISSSSSQSSSSTSSSASSSSSSASSSTLSASSTSSPAQPDMMTQLQMIMGLLPENCIGIGFSNNGIACNKCKDGFEVTASNTCKQIEKQPVQTTPAENRTNTATTMTVSQLYQSNSQSSQQKTEDKQTQTVQSSTSTTVTSVASYPQSTASTEQKVRYPPLSAPNDLNCMVLNPSYTVALPISKQNRRCKQCYPSFYYNVSQELCLSKNPLCRSCSQDNICQSCYPGYVLFEGDCHINEGKIPIIVGSSNPNNITPPNTNGSNSTGKNIDPNCQSYNTNTQVCLQCAYKYYRNTDTNICTQVDPNCKEWNANTGVCSSCFTGYIVSKQNSKLCQYVTTSSPSVTSNQAYCRQSKNGICLTCVDRFFLFKGDCFPVSDLCKSFNSNFGYCTSCYDGYGLVNGECQEIVAPMILDPYCQVWSNNRCQECLLNYYPDGDSGKCTFVSLLCNGYNRQTGHCTDCIRPYTLDISSGECIFKY